MLRPRTIRCTRRRGLFNAISTDFKSIREQVSPRSGRPGSTRAFCYRFFWSTPQYEMTTCDLHNTSRRRNPGPRAAPLNQSLSGALQGDTPSSLGEDRHRGQPRLEAPTPIRPIKQIGDGIHGDTHKARRAVTACPHPYAALNGVSPPMAVRAVAAVAARDLFVPTISAITIRGPGGRPRRGERGWERPIGPRRHDRRTRPLKLQGRP